MNSLILQTASRLLLPLLLLFSFFLLLRGHNEPGGGFEAGLVAASAYALYAFAYDVTLARQALRFATSTIVGWGLLLAFGSALLPVLLGQAFMTALWYPQEVPIIGKLGTPLIFDVGVYLVVVGGTLKVIFSMAEEEES